MFAQVACLAPRSATAATRRVAMKEMKMKKANSKIGQLLLLTALGLLLTATANAAAPGITGPTFNLVASPALITQPDGEAVYSWGYGCNGTPAGYAPSAISNGFCDNMQVPGPTLIVTQGQTVTIHLVNQLPRATGNTSILFPGFQVAATGGVVGLLTQEAPPSSSCPNVLSCTVTYTFTATTPGTRAYYSGTQGDLQVE